MPRKIELPEHIKLEVRKSYEQFPNALNTIRKIANASGYKENILYKYGRESGLNRLFGKDYKIYSDKEHGIVEKHCDKNLITIQRKLLEKGFKRTISSIMHYKANNKIVWWTTNGLSVSQISEEIGYTPDGVRYWIETGKLKAKRIEIKNKEHPYKISLKDLRNFIIEYKSMININSKNKDFIIDVLSKRIL